MALLGDGRASVRERDNVEALLARGPHGRLYTTVGKEAAQRDRLDAVGDEERLEVRVREGVEALLAFHHRIARQRRHLLAELGVPRALGKEAVFSAARENA